MMFESQAHYGPFAGASPFAHQGFLGTLPIQYGQAIGQAIGQTIAACLGQHLAAAMGHPGLPPMALGQPGMYGAPGGLAQPFGQWPAQPQLGGTPPLFGVLPQLLAGQPALGGINPIQLAALAPQLLGALAAQQVSQLGAGTGAWTTPGRGFLPYQQQLAPQLAYTG